MDSEDNILVACGQSIEVFKSDGTHLKSIGKGVVSLVCGVCMDRNGRIIVSKYSEQRVIIFLNHQERKRERGLAFLWLKKWWC